MGDFAKLLEDRSTEFFFKAFMEQAPLLQSILGDIKPRPLSARQKKALARQHELKEFAQKLHTLAVNLGATCDHEYC